MKLKISVASHGAKLNGSLFRIRKRFIYAHDVDRCVLVSVDKTATFNVVIILAAQYTMNILCLLQKSALVPSLENAGEDLTTLAATL